MHRSWSGNLRHPRCERSGNVVGVSSPNDIPPVINVRISVKQCPLECRNYGACVFNLTPNHVKANLTQSKYWSESRDLPDPVGPADLRLRPELVPEVIDRGPSWVLHLRTLGAPAGTIEVSRTDLVNGSLFIPISINDQLAAAGVPTEADSLMSAANSSRADARGHRSDERTSRLRHELQRTTQHVYRMQTDHDELLADPGVIQEDRDAATRALEYARRQLESARSAMERVDAGTHSRCAKCGNDIGEERLAALVDVTTCVRCAG
jgi:RNA polymerase-binding transcription factor DksA